MNTTQETTWAEEKGKQIDLLCSMRELSTLYAIKTNLEEKLKDCSIIGKSEYDFCSVQSRIITLNEIIIDVTKQILQLTKKDEK